MTKTLISAQLALSVFPLLWAGLPLAALAAPHIALEPPRPAASIQFDPPPPPPLGEPGNRGQGGGSRGDCDAYAAMQALVPIVLQGDQPIAWGLTTAERPTWWLYLPAGIAAGVPVELRLRDPDGKTLVKQRFTAATDPGIISLTLPDSARLQVNTVYRWSIAIYCGDDQPDTPVTLRGAIQRVKLPPQLQQAIATAPPIQQATLYAQQGIWYDALTALGNQRQAADQLSLKTAWFDLLQQGNLQSAGHASLRTCCRPQPDPSQSRF